MKVLVTGSSGFIGSAICQMLEKKGDEVFTLVRDKAGVTDHAFFWDPSNHTFDVRIDQFDAILNLSGENIASVRWTNEKKKKILKSRLDATHTLYQLIRSLKQPPRVLVNASAIGFYGNRGDELLTEESAPGNSFLADVCKQWEQAAKEMESFGCRVVILRFGAVLSTTGGALSKMLTPFKLGLGGKLGSGTQYFSFIGLQDLCRAILFVLDNEQCKGPMNAVTPYPVTNEELTKELGKKLHRPTFCHLPAFVLRLIFGEMADEILLASQKVHPKKLLGSGFQFNYPYINDLV